MAILSITKDGRRWASESFSPANGAAEVRVRFKNAGGGFVGVHRSADGLEYTPSEGGVNGNLCRDTKLLVFNISGVIPGSYLRLVSTSEPEEWSWIE
jgi:hypothetical protein